MKNNHSYRHFKIVGILFSLMINAGLVKSQDTLKTDKKFNCRLTIGVGMGSGPSQEDDYGIGIMGEFAVQRKNNVYALGIRRVEGLQILGVSHPTNSNNCLDITYGKVFTKGSFFSCISAGIGCIEGIRQGKYLSSTGGWFGDSYYEKIRFYTIGFPISAKIFWILSRFYGLGIELFVNINKNTFYGINFSHQFGKLRPAKIKRNKVK